MILTVSADLVIILSITRGTLKFVRVGSTWVVREIISHQAEEKPAFITSSVVSEGEVLPEKGAYDKEISDLDSWTEETDARLITHVEWAVRVKRCQGSL